MVQLYKAKNFFTLLDTHYIYIVFLFDDRKEEEIQSYHNKLVIPVQSSRIIIRSKRVQKKLLPGSINKAYENSDE